MGHRHAICVVVDGLRAAALGTYGNTTYPTPHLDALASRSLVADWLYADSPGLRGFYRGVWQAEHALRPSPDGEQFSILEQIRRANVLQWLVTDDPWLTELSPRLPFHEALLFENHAEQSAASVGETALGRFFAEVVQRIHQWRDDVAETSSLMWLHSRGFFGPWDAPVEYRNALLDDEDPAAIELVRPPTQLHEVDDPDVVLSYRVAYAAQAAVFDACLGAFIQALEADFATDETMVMLVGSRGLALGEHGSIGTDCPALYSERLHLPWLMCPLQQSIPLPRYEGLCQPTDIGATLLDWFTSDSSPGARDGISCLPRLTNMPCQQRELVVAEGDPHETVVRTRAWMLRRHNQQTAVQLFTKPDDRWEYNDVAGLCPEVVEGLLQELDNYEQHGRNQTPLPHTLVNRALAEPER